MNSDAMNPATREHDAPSDPRVLAAIGSHAKSWSSTHCFTLPQETVTQPDVYFPMQDLESTVRETSVAAILAAARWILRFE